MSLLRSAVLVATSSLLGFGCSSSDQSSTLSGQVGGGSYTGSSQGGAGGGYGVGAGPSSSSTSASTSASSTSASTTSSVGQGGAGVGGFGGFGGFGVGGFGVGGASNVAASSVGVGGASASSATSTGVGGAGPCAHDVCTAGVALDASCDPCVTTLCGSDPFCCDAANGQWDDVCISEVQGACGMACGNPVISPGDLVITEIMNNPAAVADSAGEWFEVYNVTANPIDMNGLNIQHQLNNPAALYTINQSLVVPPLGYVVLGDNADTATNGGVVVDYSYGNAINLANSTDILAIQTADMPPVLIDQVIWNSASGLNPNGASRNLDPNFLSASQNDDDTHFCAATTLMSDGDKGTPGLPNDPCP